jgi:hypothetical protein
MEVGDLVRPHNMSLKQSEETAEISAGIILEVRHPRSPRPDYRTPTSVLVYFPDVKTEWNERWYYTDELKMVDK